MYTRLRSKNVELIPSLKKTVEKNMQARQEENNVRINNITTENIREYEGGNPPVVSPNLEPLTREGLPLPVQLARICKRLI